MEDGWDDDLEFCSSDDVDVKKQSSVAPAPIPAVSAATTTTTASAALAKTLDCEPDALVRNSISFEDDEDEDEDDESFVPDSLRDFLRAADQKLEDDLAFLSPSSPDRNKSSCFVFDDDDHDHDAEAEAEAERERTRQQQQQQQQRQQQQYDRERERLEAEQRELELEVMLLEEQQQKEQERIEAREREQRQQREREKERLLRQEQITEHQRQIRETKELERLAQEERAQLLREQEERERERELERQIEEELERELEKEKLLREQREREQRERELQAQKDEEERSLKEQQEREQREQELQAQIEEEERLLKEQQERERRERELQAQKEEEERLLREQREREQRERELQARKEEEEQLLKEQQEREQRERELQAQKEEEERLLKEQQERERRERELLALMEEERRLKEQQEREQQERELQAQKEEEERLLKEQKEREQRERELQAQKEEEERLLKEQQEWERRERELLALMEEERLLKEQQEREQQERELQAQIEEEERLLKEQQEREQRERELQAQIEEEERLLKEQQEWERRERELLALMEEERLLKEQQEREQQERELQAQKEEEERLSKEQQERERQREMQKLRERERLAQLEKDRLLKEQQEMERKLREARERELLAQKEKERFVKEQEEREREMQEARERELLAQKELEKKQQQLLELEKQRERERKKLLEEEEARKRLEEIAAAERELERLTATTPAAAEEDDDDEDYEYELMQSSSKASLLDVINPSANVTESHLRRIAMEGAECFEEDETANEEADLLPLVSNAINTPLLPVPSPMIDGINAGAAADAKNMILATAMTSGGVPCPSPPAAKRKLQMELDREAHRASLDEKNNQTLDRRETKRNQQSSIEKQQKLTKSQSPSLERRRRIQELEAKRKSLEISRGKKKIGEANAVGDKSKFKTTPRKTEKAVPKPQAQGMEFNATDAAPSNAAAAAANQAAAVVSANGSDEGPIAIPDVVEKTGKTLSSSAGRVGRPATRSGRNKKEMQKQPTQQRQFQSTDPQTKSPPKPTEIITSNAIFEDGRTRSVSPLGGEMATGTFQKEIDVVSPLASPAALRKNRGGASAFERRQSNPFANDNKEDQRQNRSTSHRRRQLTRPNHAFDRLSRRTLTNNAAKHGTDTQQKPESKRTAPIDPEEEQRKARERIRKRMELQRKKAAARGGAPSDGPMISPRGMTNNSSSAEKGKKSNARREKMLRMEQERVAKLKAKLKAKEERLQTKNKTEEKKIPQRPKPRLQTAPAQQSEPEQREPEDSKSRRSNKGAPALTVPIAPKFATDHRIGAATSNKPPTKDKTRERRSLASSAEIFGKGLRSSAPPPPRSSATPEQRQLTIPKAPKLVTSQRLGEKSKSTPFSSPNKKKREVLADEMSWSSTLRDVSGISPISKATSSVKTGNLTIPVTPHFQPIRKRPLPKSTAEKEKEEMQYYKDHPFKAREIKMNASSSTTKKPVPPPRPLTQPKPFNLHTSSSQPRHENLDKEKKEEVQQFKARPMPDFNSKKLSLDGKKSPTSWRPLTTPKPFTFQKTVSRKHSVEKNREAKSSEKTGAFKALPMPDFKSSKGNKKLKSPPSRPLMTPEPPQVQSDSKNRPREESDEGKKATGFKARPMPKFDTKNATPLTGNRPKSGKKFTRTEPFNLGDRNQTGAVEQRKTRSKEIPTGASGILFRRSIETSNRLSRPKVVTKPKSRESKPFRAKTLPDLIPEVIVTTTPVASSKQSESQARFSRREEKKDSSFYPPHSRTHDRINKNKECDNSTISSYIKSPTRDERTISISAENLGEVRSPAPVKSPMGTAATSENLPESQVRHAPLIPESSDDRPVPQSDRNSSGVASPQLNTSTISGMEDAKARLRERLSKRRSNAAQKPTGDNSKTANSSPKAFSTTEVQSRLNSQAEKNAKLKEKLRRLTQQRKAEASSANYVSDAATTPVKSNSTNPGDIGLPLKSASPTEKRELFSSEGKDIEEPDEDTVTPQISNNSRKSMISKSTLEQLRRGQDPPKDNYDETHLAPSMSNEDESSSILQLAQEVQRAAVDELSFYGSYEERTRLEHELGI